MLKYEDERIITTNTQLQSKKYIIFKGEKPKISILNLKQCFFHIFHIFSTNLAR